MAYISCLKLLSSIPVIIAAVPTNISSFRWSAV